MKTILIAMVCAMAACAVDGPEAATSTSEQGLVCDPNCDPGGGQVVIGQVFGYALSIFPDAYLAPHNDFGCRDNGFGTECWAEMITDANPFQDLYVFCNSNGCYYGWRN